MGHLTGDRAAKHAAKKRAENPDDWGHEFDKYTKGKGLKTTKLNENGDEEPICQTCGGEFMVNIFGEKRHWKAVQQDDHAVVWEGSSSG